ncbi:ABC transporter substrate-binding protein [Achromobacter xylosoxidans]
MSGVYADVTGKGSATAAEMAIADFGGQVLGKKIDLLVADHQNKADIAAARAREWYDTQKVDAIMDVAGSAPALAVLEVAREKNASWSTAVPAPSASPTTCARPIRCTTPTTPGRWPTPPRAPRWSKAARAGIS